MNSKAEKFWHKIEISHAAQYSQLISSFLMDLGSVGLEENEDQIKVYFRGSSNSKFIQSEIQQYLDRLKKELNLSVAFEIFASEIETENWQQNWMQYFKPIFIEDRLVITPSWEQVFAEKGKIIITIDPEQAFGTGGHATTCLMLRLLLKYCFPGMQVLDVGTGSGILAIAAAKLGSGQIVAFDIDPVAVKTAKKNSELNGVSGQINYFCGEISALRPKQKQYNFLLANISSGALRNLLPGFSLLLNNTNSFLSLSGILCEEVKIFSNLLTEYHLKIIEIIEQDGWVSFLCKPNQF